MTKSYWITEDRIKELNHRIENGKIEHCDVNISECGTYTELVLGIYTSCSYVNPLGGTNITKTLGPVILALAELLEATPGERGGLRDFDQLPCRVIRHHTTGYVIGIGHFLYDRFVIFEDMINALK